MDINYFNLVRYSNILGRYSLETPSHTYVLRDLEEYTVQENEDMRFDLIILSIYEDKMYYEYLDVILYINNIDNPLNVRYGQKILYPSREDLDLFRIDIESTELLGDKKVNINGNHSKINRVDKNRADFINNNYTLNPVQSTDNQGSVSLEGNSLKITGLNSN